MAKLPRNVDILDTYVQALYHWEEWNELINLVNQRMNEVENHSRILFHLAGAYEQKGFSESAEQYYQASLNAESLNPLGLPISRDALEKRLALLREKIRQGKENERGNF